MTDSEPTVQVPPTPQHECTEAAGGRIMPFITLAVLWALLVFLVQEYTTGSNYPLSAAKTIGSRVVRFALDLLACGSLAFLVRGWLLHVLIGGWAVASSVLLMYHDYFGKALSWTTLSNHFSEGMALGPYVLDLLHWPSFLLTLVATVSLVLLGRRANRTSIDGSRRLKLGTVALGCLFVSSLASTQFIDKIAKLKSFGTVDRLAMTNGYVLSWIGEWWHLDGAALLLRANEAARRTQNRLTPLESPVQLGDSVVMIQVESLDYDVIDHEVGSEPVMPFLADLATQSMFFRIAAIHESGSCDADFVMLMNLYPAGDVTPYRVPGFDWSQSIVKHAASAGYLSTFFHGNDSSFFHRGSAILQMGFHRSFFREELEAQFNLASKNWGISDEDLLTTSRRLLVESTGRSLHFIITLTSHAPFHFVDQNNWELFPQAKSKSEHYLNSMRYVDTQLKAFVDGLPDGSMVILYGDHSSHVDYRQPVNTTGREYIPFLIHQVGQDLASQQRTRGQDIATSGELTLLDAAGYVWSLLARTPGDEG
jgi:hypothetical protein